MNTDTSFHSPPKVVTKPSIKLTEYESLIPKNKIAKTNFINPKSKIPISNSLNNSNNFNKSNNSFARSIRNFNPSNFHSINSSEKKTNINLYTKAKPKKNNDLVLPFISNTENNPFFETKRSNYSLNKTKCIFLDKKIDQIKTSLLYKQINNETNQLINNNEENNKNDLLSHKITKTKEKQFIDCGQNKSFGYGRNEKNDDYFKGDKNDIIINKTTRKNSYNNFQLPFNKKFVINKNNNNNLNNSNMNNNKNNIPISIPNGKLNKQRNMNTNNFPLQIPSFLCNSINSTIKVNSKDKNKMLKTVDIEDKNHNKPKRRRSEIKTRTYAFGISKAGLDENGEPKTNQDSFILEKSLLGLKNFDIFGVFDGHGASGHLVSKYISNEFDQYFTIKANYPSNIFPQNKDITDINSQITQTNQNILNNLSAYLSSNYTKVFNDLYSTIDSSITDQKFDSLHSGSTATLIIRIGKKLFLSNAGDSRCIVVKRKLTKSMKLKDKFTVLKSTIDHKPNLPFEKLRIETNGGEVRTIDDEDCGYTDVNNDNVPMCEKKVYRVYKKGKDEPGLAVSRALGDMDAKKAGVICKPELCEINLADYDNPTDRVIFCVCCSDGVWDYIGNDEIIEIVVPFYLKGDAEGAADMVVRRAEELWGANEVRRDDISCVVVFL